MTPHAQRLLVASVKEAKVEKSEHAKKRKNEAKPPGKSKPPKPAKPDEHDGVKQKTPYADAKAKFIDRFLARNENW